MEDLKRAIAFLFRRKGRDALTEKEFVMSASMDLGWFPPRDAQRLLQIGLDSKLLTSTEGKLRPAFDVGGVEVPLDYAPPATLLQVEVPAPDLFARILERILSATNLEKKHVMSIINSTQDEMDVEVEVAALIVGRDLGVDISAFLPDVEEQTSSRLG